MFSPLTEADGDFTQVKYSLKFGCMWAAPAEGLLLPSADDVVPTWWEAQVGEKSSL